MLEALNDWTAYVDKNIPVDVVYLDFSKAFDRVSHRKLCYKLRTVGIHPRIIDWIRAFLSERTYRVRINRTFSTPRPVNSGVPQGGVLSPVLFNIYCYELPTIIGNHGVSCCAYADDFKVYHCIQNADDRAKIQSALEAVDRWSVCWELPLSKEKTKVLHIGANNPHHTYRLRLSDLDTVEKIVDLGFLIKGDLSFDDHCKAIALRATRLTYNIFRALSTNNPIVLIKAFKTYVRPILEYGTVVFNPYKAKNILALEKVQNSFTRKVLIRSIGFSYNRILNSKERNLNFSLESLAVRRRKFDLIMVYKMLFGQSALDNKAFFKLNSSFTRGATRKLRIPCSRKNVRRHFFTCRAAADFEKLAKKFAIPPKLSTFLGILDKYLKS